jgi:DNA helicase HerA-like ATPase
MRGARKFGLGTVMVSQTITGIDVNVLQNIPLMIILGGSDAYVKGVAEVLNLTNEDVRWLTTALPPHMAGLTTKALVITGPIKRQATIELEPSVKGFIAL